VELYYGMYTHSKYIKNREAILACQKRYRLAHRERYLKNRREYTRYKNINILTYARDCNIDTFLQTTKKYNVEILSEPVENIVRDRFKLFYDFLIQRPNKTFWIICDSRDILFQHDFKLERDKVYLSSEGITHADPWNSLDQHHWQLHCRHKSNYSEWEVINGGFLAGPADKLANLCLLIWTTLLQNTAIATDQAVINYLYHTVLKDKITLLKPDDGVIVHSYGICSGQIAAGIHDGKLVNANSVPWSIVHQYDRLPAEVQEGFVPKKPALRKVKEFTVSHSGNAGDLIWHLCALKSILRDRGIGKCLLLLKPFKYAQELLPLLNQQYYLEARMWKDEEIDLELDSFRRNPNVAKLGDIGLWPTLDYVCTPDFHTPWLESRLSINKLTPGKVLLFNRTLRYQNPNLNYNILNGDNLVGPPFVYFVGLPEENIYDLPQVDCPGICHLAGLIKGSDLFIGNQSLAFAIASALDHPRVLEVCPELPNVMPHTDKCVCVWNQSQLYNAIATYYHDHIQPIRYPTASATP
jgi:hypothetical protein